MVIGKIRIKGKQATRKKTKRERGIEKEIKHRQTDGHRNRQTAIEKGKEEEEGGKGMRKEKKRREETKQDN